MIITRLKHFLINQNSNHYYQHIFATRRKFIYFCKVKIDDSGFDQLSESIFYLLLVVEVLSLKKVVEMLEEMVVS